VPASGPYFSLMFTKLMVGNSALSIIGEAPVTEISETATEGVKSRVLFREWNFALDELLRAFPWNWAKKRAILDEASPAPPFEWSHAFVLPVDYITALALNETALWNPGSWWEIEGGFLLTDTASAQLEYIARPAENETTGASPVMATDAFLTRMDPLARQALIVLLAAKIAPSVTKDGLQKANELLMRYVRQDLAQARLKAAGESKAPWPSIRTDSAFDASRRGP
jgi:hypothetical protein